VCVLQGIGGVGKSALAGRIMARLSEDGWHCVTLAGAFNIDSLARALGLANDDDATRLRSHLPAPRQRALLLVLDNFESNLSVGGEAWLDDTVPTWLQLLCAKVRAPGGSCSPPVTIRPVSPPGWKVSPCRRCPWPRRAS
jgi:hypothetical protein